MPYKDPAEYKACQKFSAKKWAQANPAKCTARTARWRKRNKVKYLAMRKKWDKTYRMKKHKGLSVAELRTSGLRMGDFL